MADDQPTVVPDLGPAELVKVIDDVIQELFAIGLHLARMQGLPDRELAVVEPLADVLARTVESLRESIKMLVAQGGRPEAETSPPGGPRR